MLTPFRLAQPSNIDWRKTFLVYTQKMYRLPLEEAVFRTVEDECEEMTRIECFIASNQNVQMDMTWLESLEKYHIDYISWLGTIKSSFKFENTYVTAVDQQFKAIIQLQIKKNLIIALKLRFTGWSTMLLA